MESIHDFKPLSFFLIAEDIPAAAGGIVRESTTSAKGINDDNSNDDPPDDSDGHGNKDSGGVGVGGED